MPACMVQARRLNAEGRGAATVFRDRESGKAVSKDAFLESRKDARAKVIWRGVDVWRY